MSKTNHGPCLVCGRPILYQGGRFCSPKCSLNFMGGGTQPHAPIRPAPILSPEPVAVAIAEPEAVKEEEAGVGRPWWLSSLESPPDE